MMFIRRKRLPAVALAAALGLAGCSAGNSAPAQRTLTLGITGGASTFAAKDIHWAQESPLVQAVYDTLLRAAPDGSIQPGLATAWKYSSDKTVMTLTLRDDVTFSDGTKFDAAAARASLLAFKAGTSPDKTDLKNVKDVVAVDKTTLQIFLTQPDPALETFLTQDAGVVESPAANPSTINTVPDGSGPYTLNTAETVVGSHYVFDKNKNYWNPSDQHYDQIVMNVYADPTSQLNAIKGGQVNVSVIGDNTTIPQVQGAGYTAVGQELNWSGFLLADRNGKVVPALADVRVRQAINYAIDRKALLQAMGAGYGDVTEQVFPTYSPSYDKSLDDYYSYDPAKAKQLLSEAGYGQGLTLTLPRATNLPASQFTLMADQLAKIGITVNYQDLQIKDYVSSVLGGKYPMAWFKLQEDPTDFQLASFQIDKAATWNPFHTNDPTVEGLVARLQNGDTSAGKDLNRYVVENAWFAPFFRTQDTKAVDANTTIQTQAGNVWPYLWNIKPKS